MRIPRRALLVLAGLLAGTLALAIAFLVLSRTAPDLKCPILIAEAYALSDGGSEYYRIQAADGTSIVIGTTGALATPRHLFPIFVRRWPHLPLPPVYLAVGGKEERALIAKLVQWASSSNASTANAQAFAHFANELAKRSK